MYVVCLIGGLCVIWLASIGVKHSYLVSMLIFGVHVPVSGGGLHAVHVHDDMAL